VLILMKRLTRTVAAPIITKTLGDEQGLVPLAVRQGPLQGLRFKLDLSRTIEWAYWLGSYEQTIVQKLADVIQPGWVIWDCGVYLGYYSALFAKFAGATGQVVGFEPDPHNLERAQANMQLNHLDNTHFIHAAIGAPLGETEFLLSDNTNSHLPGVYIGGSVGEYAANEQIVRTISVTCMSLDQAFEDERIPKPDFIKIDIEGAEKEALNYLHKLVEKQRPIIALELHNPECDAAAWEFAEREVYSLQSLDTGLMINRREDVHGTLLCRPPVQ
jgi:FkbM family methyltransferase